MLQEYYKRRDRSTFRSVLDEVMALRERVEPLVADVAELMHALSQAAGASLLFEGAQGAMLDIDHGTYPFVTSSNTIAGARLDRYRPRGRVAFDSVIGIVKAYTTRVGSGPFPTELVRRGRRCTCRKQVGHEFGSTTGRPRRCGWFDAVALRRAVQLSSVTSLCITKLDVLDGLDTLRIATGYRIDGEVSDHPPMLPHRFSECEPVYETHPGWQEPTGGITEFARLPENARRYLARIEELAGVPIDIVSTGPDRAETIVLRHPFD
jgi:adenylosuccinate synthase